MATVKSLISMNWGYAHTAEAVRCSYSIVKSVDIIGMDYP